MICFGHFVRSITNSLHGRLCYWKISASFIAHMHMTKSIFQELKYIHTYIYVLRSIDGLDIITWNLSRIIFSICFKMHSDLLPNTSRLHREHSDCIHIEYCGLINLSFISDLSKCIIILAVNHHISLVVGGGGHFNSIRTDLSVCEISQTVFGHIRLSESFNHFDWQFIVDTRMWQLNLKFQHHFK